MPSNDKLIELMLHREDEQARGQPVSLVALCADKTELLPELERLCSFADRLEALAKTADTPTIPCEETSELPTVDIPGEQRQIPCPPNYQIIQELAEGGMGRVYHARDTRLARDVALKVIRPEKLSTDLLARFATEGRAVARLNHPHIVQIYEVGEMPGDEGGSRIPFLALEYVSGGTLEERAGRKPMPPAEAARMVALLAGAMAHAHARSVVHRDLKPANVLIGPPAQEAALNAELGQPKITDFGLARAQEDIRAHCTTPGAVMGTPAYMAPEQAEGRLAGPPADVYALGAILYRLLTGRVVFESNSWVDTLHHVCHTPPRPVREVVKGVPPALEAVCLRCLHKQPSERPTAAELVKLLEQPRADNRDLLPPKPRWPWVAGAAAAAVVLLLLGGLWVIQQQSPEQPTEVVKSDPPQPPMPKDPEKLPPLKGYVDAQMTRPGDKLRQHVPMHNPASRPMRMKDQIRVFGELNRPAYVYLVWITSEGTVTPMYPWIDGDWKQREPERKMRDFKLPQVNGNWEVWEMGPGKPGLETMVLLCRDEILPSNVDLQAKLGEFGEQSFKEQDSLAVSWFENGYTVRDEPKRAPLAKAVKGGNALEQLNREIFRRVQQDFSYMRSITYGNEGGVKKEE